VLREHDSQWPLEIKEMSKGAANSRRSDGRSRYIACKCQFYDSFR
jgi:hypothetical protein